MTVLFLINGAPESAMGDRARAFASRLSSPWRPVLAYREAGRGAAIRAFRAALDVSRPDVVYVMDMAVATIAAALLWRIRHRVHVVVDTGDAITELARSSGVHGPLGVAATGAVEQIAMRLADELVVRGSFHKELLAGRQLEISVIPDGVDLNRFSPVDAAATRGALGFGRELVIGVLGSCTWSPRLQIAYGWDLVEALAKLSTAPVRGLLIGDGSGIAPLMERARALGVADRLVLAGRRPMDQLPGLLAACDVCLSTQTNDIPGNVRTTGKLPLYLACGRFVLASEVGEAARVLPAEMLVPYDGVVDRAYPDRLADRVRAILAGHVSHSPDASVQIARRHFDYDMLARRVQALLSRALDARATRQAAART